jgi:hypothetical protein
VYSLNLQCSLAQSPIFRTAWEYALGPVIGRKAVIDDVGRPRPWEAGPCRCMAPALAFSFMSNSLKAEPPVAAWLIWLVAEKELRRPLVAMSAKEGTMDDGRC